MWFGYQDRYTFDLVLETLDFGIRVIDDFFEVTLEVIILVGKVLAHCFVVQSELSQWCWCLSVREHLIHLLRCLVCPKGQAPSSTFRDRGRVQTTQHTGLVVFCWLKDSRDGVVRF